MFIDGANHIDRQLRLTPADYATTPQQFGHNPNLQFRTPPTGDTRSGNVAIVQHRLIIAWRTDTNGNGAQLARRWGISRQTVSRILLVQRPMGTVLAAALLTATHATRPHQDA